MCSASLVSSVHLLHFVLSLCTFMNKTDTGNGVDDSSQQWYSRLQENRYSLGNCNGKLTECLELPCKYHLFAINL